MKISIPENLSPIDAIRHCGYGLVNDRRNPEQSFARRMGSGIYPRFHVYLETHFINLHLDQKQASYEGQSKHSGEYSGDTVEHEASRISEMLEKMSIEAGNTGRNKEPEEKGGWLSRFF
ncbi:MAG: hypothetical protein WCP18_00750 [bacterium]